jgi:hypothetical protein
MKSANNRFEHTLICVFVTLCSSIFFENKNANWSRVKYIIILSNINRLLKTKRKVAKVKLIEYL